MRNKRIIITALCTILCVGIVLGISLFLLLRNEEPTHIQAEGLNLELQRTKLTQFCLGSDGKMHEVINDEPKDFSKVQKENIFGLKDGDIIVPSSKYQADLKVKAAKPVSFAYWISIDLNQGANAFAEQLLVTIKIDDKETSFRLSNSTSFGSEKEPLKVVDKEEASTFTVKVYFVDDQMINDDAINQAIYFDLVVCAVQIN